MFMGEYHHNLDEKSRIVIPSIFRDELKSNFIIAKGLENCLYIFSMNEWNKVVQKLESLPFTKKDVRIFKRSFFSGASNVEIDKSGRIVISSNLKDYAKINRECVIIGAGDRIEIWDKDEWNKFIESYDEKISDIAENLLMDVEL